MAPPRGLPCGDRLQRVVPGHGRSCGTEKGPLSLETPVEQTDQGGIGPGVAPDHEALQLAFGLGPAGRAMPDDRGHLLIRAASNLDAGVDPGVDQDDPTAGGDMGCA